MSNPLLLQKKDLYCNQSHITYSRNLPLLQAVFLFLPLFNQKGRGSSNKLLIFRGGITGNQSGLGLTSYVMYPWEYRPFLLIVIKTQKHNVMSNNNTPLDKNVRQALENTERTVNMVSTILTLLVNSDIARNIMTPDMLIGLQEAAYTLIDSYADLRKVIQNAAQGEA